MKSSASLGGAIPNAAWVPTEKYQVSVMSCMRCQRDAVFTHGRTNVQAVSLLVGYPLLVDADKLLHKLNDGISLEALFKNLY